MSYRLSTLLRNDRANQLLARIGASPILRFYTGSAPAAASDPATGTLLAALTLPAVWLAAASGGQVAQAGAWTTPSALASGTPGYFRIFDATGVTCHIQGLVPDELVGSPVPDIVVGTSVTVSGYVWTEAGA